MNELGIFLKELRGNKSLRQVTKGTKVSHTYLGTLEKGFDPRNNKERKPTPDILREISKIYGVEYKELLGKAGYL